MPVISPTEFRNSFELENISLKEGSSILSFSSIRTDELSTILIGGMFKGASINLIVSSTSLAPVTSNFLEVASLLDVSLADNTISLYPSFFSAISSISGSTGIFVSTLMVDIARYCVFLGSSVIEGSSSFISPYSGFTDAISKRPARRVVMLLIVFVLDLSCVSPEILIEYFLPDLATGYRE